MGIRSPGIGYGDDSVRQKFTGKERDETDLDYFGERYYSSVQGRFISVDPLGASATVANPQSFNRYVYVLNNPLRYVDPDGLDAQDPWASLTDEERNALAPKLVTCKQSGACTNAELATAREAFNNQKGIKVFNADGTLNVAQTETNIASVQNFIAEFAGDAKIWNEVGSFLGVNSIGVGKQSDVYFTVNNRENFLKALDDAKDARGNPRFTSWFAMGHVDSMRELGYDVLNPSMHIERFPDKGHWYAHWDPTSPLTIPTFIEGLQDGLTLGTRRIWAAGLHEVLGRAKTGEVKNLLKFRGLTPRK